MRERHHVTYKSGNGKTGPMTVVRTDTRTCPPSCKLLLDGDCYDLGGNGRMHRMAVDAGTYKTVASGQLLELMKKFSRVFRLNEGGDLWGKAGRIDGKKLDRFLKRAKELGKLAIIYTHKPVAGIHSRGSGEDRLNNRKAIREALKGQDVAVNISCDSMEEVDRAMDRGYDATVVLPMDTGKGMTRTPGGHRVVTCPASYGPIQCVTCGSGKPLCTRKERGYAVGFPAHGMAKKRLSLRIIRQEG